MYGELKIFGGRAHPALAQEICDYLEPAEPASVDRFNFSDGETFCQIDENVRGSDVFIVQPTCEPVNENLMELLILLDAFKRSSASRVTAVLPYYGYARQDKKDKPRVPITAKLVADLISARRRRPRADHGPPRRPDPGLLRRAGGPPVRRAGAARGDPRAARSRTWSSSRPTPAASSGRAPSPSGSRPAWRSSTSAARRPTRPR